MAKFWEVLEGWKTRIWSVAMFLLGLVALLDPRIFSTALGLGDRGTAVIIVLFAVGTFILREMTKGPTAPMLPKGKDK